jgi:hypothetical protein
LKKNKFLLERALHLATACAIFSLLFFALATVAQSKSLCIFFYVLSAALLVMGGVILYLSHRAKSARINYFLYDRQRGLPLPPKALSFEGVNEGVESYLSDYVKQVVDLWTDIPKPLRMQLDVDVAFRPLIAYRMLLELSEREPEEILNRFQKADDRVVAYLCRAVKEGGDRDMADYVFEMKRHVDRELDRVPAFFRKNRRGFQERMLRYTERHVNDFYVEKKRLNKQISNG